MGVRGLAPATTKRKEGIRRYKRCDFLVWDNPVFYRAVTWCILVGEGKMKVYNLGGDMVYLGGDMVYLGGDMVYLGGDMVREGQDESV